MKDSFLDRLPGFLHGNQGSQSVSFRSDLKKAKVYVETSVVAYLTGRPARDLVIAAHQELTRQWWAERSSAYALYVSELVREEASKGDPAASDKRIVAIQTLPVLCVNDAAVDLAENLVVAGPIPEKASADALHIAIATVNGVDFLLTWNCKHLANAAHRHSLESLIEDFGYACPVICTPEELMED